MRRSRAVLAIVVALALSTAGAAGCTAAEPDWEAAQAEADAFLESSGAITDCP